MRVAIDCDAFVRLASIRATSETVEDALHPSVLRRAELKHRATSKVAAEHCRPVDVSRAVRLQIGVSVFAVVLFEAKDDVCLVAVAATSDSAITKSGATLSIESVHSLLFLPFPLELIF